MKTYDEIFEKVKEILVDLFDIEEAQITKEANLYEDLDLDSIDAIDMVVQIQKMTGKKVSPESFKEVRTINDVVNAILTLLKE